VIWRLAALVDEDADLVYGDHNLADAETGEKRGRIVLYDVERVYVVDVAGPDKVRAEVFRRSELCSVAVDCGDGHNLDASWDGEYKDWPSSRSVIATYSGRAPLRLPLGPDPTPRQASTFGAFLPSLLGDLGRAP
jgi:hypothetical protein